MIRRLCSHLIKRENHTAKKINLKEKKMSCKKKDESPTIPLPLDNKILEPANSSGFWFKSIT